MIVNEKVQALLLAADSITSITPRIGSGFMGEQVDLPYISHSPVANYEGRTHSGRTKMQFWDYRIKVFALDEAGTWALAAAVMALFQNCKSGGMQVTRAVYLTGAYMDPERVFQQVVELSIAESL